MKRCFLVLSALLLIASPVHADFDAGVAAYDRGDYATALKEFGPLAKKGFAGAQYNLGLMYYKGQGVTRNFAEALKWLRKAADKDFAGAEYILGFMYQTGQGVPRDFTAALDWYQKAADQGHASAMYNLGIMYYKGQGVVPNYVQAALWTNLAANLSRGKTRAHFLRTRDSITKKMTRAEIAEAQRLARKWKPKKAKTGK